MKWQSATILGCSLILGLATAGQNATAQTASQPSITGKSANDALWDDRFVLPGLNFPARDIAFDDAGNMYAAGSYSIAGSVTAGGIAKFDGIQWTALAPYTGLPSIDAVALDSAGTVYVAGGFGSIDGVPASRVAKWDGATWTALGTGVNQYVRAMVSDTAGANIYVGGIFSIAGGVAAQSVARWDGAAWHSVGVPPFGNLYDLAVSPDDTLYAGGQFGVIKWTGTKWDTLGTFNNNVQGLAFAPDGTPYAVGQFSMASGAPANRITRWNGTSWVEVGGGANGHVYGAAFDEAGNLFVHGGFTMVGATPAKGLAMWSGSSWTSLGDDLFNALSTPGVSGITFDPLGNLIVSGPFEGSSDVVMKNIGRWNGTQWSPISTGLGLSGSVYDMALHPNGSIVVAGLFGTAGSLRVNNIASWNGTTWDSLGPGLPSIAYSTAVGASGDVYASGPFADIWGLTVNYVGKWNGSAWTALGSGLNNWAKSLHAGAGDTLFAGGFFTMAGGNPANHVAVWDGTSWDSLGPGFNDDVEALVKGPDGSLFAGGAFTMSGSTPISHVAKWSGSGWEPLGSGLPQTVFSLAFRGDTLYAGATGINTAVMRWNGSVWTAAPDATTLVGGTVRVLAVDDVDYLYAGGNLHPSSIGNGLAVLNDVGWSGVGSGLDAEVTSVIVVGPNIYVGGSFGTAGGKASNGFAIWGGASLPVELAAFDAIADGLTVRLNWETASESNNAGFEVQLAEIRIGETSLYESIGFVPGRGTTIEQTRYSFETDPLDPGLYRFRLKQIDLDGAVEYSPTVEATVYPGSPLTLSLPYPNPATTKGSFELVLAEQDHVSVKLFDVMGRQVRLVFDGSVPASRSKRIELDTTELARGMYFLRAETERATVTRSLVVGR